MKVKDLIEALSSATNPDGIVYVEGVHYRENIDRVFEAQDKVIGLSKEAYADANTCGEISSPEYVKLIIPLPGYEVT